MTNLKVKRNYINNLRILLLNMGYLGISVDVLDLNRWVMITVILFILILLIFNRKF